MRTVTALTIIGLAVQMTRAAEEADAVRAAAAKIDALVLEGIAKGNEGIAAIHARDVENARRHGWPELKLIVPITPNPALTDEQFVRRAHLDITGTIPTAAQVSAFLDDESPAKRAMLIDRLLDSDGLASHLYNALADMLRVKTDAEIPDVRMLAYGDWLKQQLRANRPYDEIVRALLTAKGKAWDGPAGFFLRDHGMPLEHLTHTMWAFLGTDISCAQCHDHPFADWTQRQFYEMAAFSVGVRTQRPVSYTVGIRLAEEAAQLAASNGGADARTIRYRIWQVMKANHHEVWDDPQRIMRFAEDYKYKDGNPGDVVLPRLIQWGRADEMDPVWVEAVGALQEDDNNVRRETFAIWLTHPQNPRFAMTIAHRLWARAFGKPIAYDLKNIDDPDDSSNPALLKHLAAEMVRVKFDLSAFLRIVCNTQAWQRAATVEDVPMGRPYFFQGPVLRRMSAEQVWDSVVTLALGEAPVLHDSANDLYGRSINLELNSPKLDAKTLLLKVAAASAVTEKKDKLPAHRALKLIRASEHDQPAPPTHPLRTFGQSEREWMDSNSTDGSIPQVLALMNGPVSVMVTRPEHHVLRTREQAGQGAAGVESVFLSVLGRKPTAHELERALRRVKAGDGGWSDLVWALLNTREFLFVQ